MKSISEFALEHEAATRLLLKFDLSDCMESVLKNIEIPKLNKVKFVKILFPNYLLEEITKIVEMVNAGATFPQACSTADVERARKL